MSTTASLLFPGLMILLNVTSTPQPCHPTTIAAAVAAATASPAAAGAGAGGAIPIPRLELVLVTLSVVATIALPIIQIVHQRTQYFAHACHPLLVCLALVFAALALSLCVAAIALAWLQRISLDAVSGVVFALVPALLAFPTDLLIDVFLRLSNPCVATLYVPPHRFAYVLCAHRCGDHYACLPDPNRPAAAPAHAPAGGGSGGGDGVSDQKRMQAKSQRHHRREATTNRRSRPLYLPPCRGPMCDACVYIRLMPRKTVLPPDAVARAIQRQNSLALVHASPPPAAAPTPDISPTALAGAVPESGATVAAPYPTILITGPGDASANGTPISTPAALGPPTTPAASTAATKVFSNGSTYQKPSNTTNTTITSSSSPSSSDPSLQSNSRSVVRARGSYTAGVREEHTPHCVILRDVQLARHALWFRAVAGARELHARRVHVGTQAGLLRALALAADVAAIGDIVLHVAHAWLRGAVRRDDAVRGATGAASALVVNGLLAAVGLDRAWGGAISAHVTHDAYAWPRGEPAELGLLFFVLSVKSGLHSRRVMGGVPEAVHWFRAAVRDRWWWLTANSTAGVVTPTPPPRHGARRDRQSSAAESTRKRRPRVEINSGQDVIAALRGCNGNATEFEWEKRRVVCEWLELWGVQADEVRPYLDEMRDEHYRR